MQLASSLAFGRRMSVSVLAIVGFVVLMLGTSDARAATHEVTEAPPLEWGVKESWRTYVGLPEFSGGATRVQPGGGGVYNVGWEFVGGSYDDTARATELRYRGSVRWRKYPGYGGLPPDVYALDLTLSDPVVTITRDRATISAVSHSRGFGNDQGAVSVDIADLAADTITPTLDGGVTTWSLLPATLTADGAEQFGAGSIYYSAGTAVDPLSFSYNGPGGAPDFSDEVVAPGSRLLALGDEYTRMMPPNTPNYYYQLVAIDRERALMYYRVRESTDTLNWRYRALDLNTGDILEDSFAVPVNGEGALGSRLLALDDATGRVYVNPATGASSSFDEWFRYVRGQGFERGALANPVPVKNGSPGSFTENSAAAAGIAWDAAHRRAFEVVREVPDGVAADDYDNHQWQLRTYFPTDESGDVWESKVYDLTNGPQYQNRYRYTAAGNGAASDGSLIILGDQQVSSNPVAAPAPTTVPGAFRVVTSGDTATVTPIAGTEVPNSAIATDRFDIVVTGSDGIVALGSTATGRTRRIDITPEDVPITAEAEVNPGFTSFPVDLRADSFTIDPEDGTVWIAGMKSQRLVGLREGRIVADQRFIQVSTKVAGLIAGPDHTLWTHATELTGSGTIRDTSFGHPTGLQKLERVGLAATVSADPQDRAVQLAADQEAEEVTFTVAATFGNPEAPLRWQAKTPGSVRFRDLEGESESSLTIDARRGMDGTEYRILLENAAGAVASEAALLSVDYPPVIGLHPVDRAIEPGEPAEFDLLTDANPVPQVQWQRQVGGFWQAVDPDSGDFLVEDNKLTIKEVNPGMDGAMFRARVTNVVGTTFSRSAKLTVKRAVTEPVTFGSGSVEWGFANRWRCYVVGTIARGGVEVSGGVSQIPGTEASGSLCPVSTAQSQAFSFPVRGGSYDPVAGKLEVKFNGKVRFWGHTYHVPGDTTPQLDTTFSDFKLIASGDEGTLYADVVGATLENPTRVSREDVPLVSVDLSDAGPVANGEAGLNWSGAETTLTTQGAEVFGSYPEGEEFDPLAMALVYGTPQPDPGPDTPAPDLPSPIGASGPAGKVKAAAKRQRLGKRRVVRLGTLVCPGKAPCRVLVRKRVRVKVAGKRFSARVVAPKWVGAGKRAALRARLPRAAAGRLKSKPGRKAAIRVKVRVLANGNTTARVLRVVVRG